MAKAKSSVTTPNELHVLLLCGSPRKGVSRQLTALIAQAIAEKGAVADIFALNEHKILPCTGCGSCTKDGKCVISMQSDDNGLLHKKLDNAAALGVISPIYFAGVPSQLKAAYDRLQTYWASEYVLGKPRLKKRPAQLFVVGDSGSPYGFDGLTLTTKSALAPAGFTLEKTLSFVGFDPSKAEPSEQLPYKLQIKDIGSDNDDKAPKAKELIAAGVQSEFIQRAHDAGGALVRAAQAAIK